MNKKILAPHEATHLIIVRNSWDKCMAILGVEIPDEEKIPEWLEQFTSCLKYGEKALEHSPENNDLQAIMAEIHYSLKGISDINQNQKALFYYWRGRVFVINAAGLDNVKDMSNVIIDLLENYSLPAYQKALSLLPSYTAAKNEISNTQKKLRKVQNPKKGLFSNIFGS